MFLTGDAQGTAATVSDAGSLEHAHRSIVFGASLLRIERGPLPTTQRAISLQEESLVLPGFLLAGHVPICAGPKSSSLSADRSADGRAFSSRGENSVRRIEVGCLLLAEFLAQIPDRLGQDLPGFLTRVMCRNSTDHLPGSRSSSAGTVSKLPRCK